LGLGRRIQKREGLPYNEKEDKEYETCKKKVLHTNFCGGGNLGKMSDSKNIGF